VFRNPLRNPLVDYELTCECGNKIRVRETAAGAREECVCGRTIVVPSLHELRRRAGFDEPKLSPEKTVETLLLAGKLPQEDHCVLCSCATDDFILCTTECERAYVQSGRPPWWVYLLGYMTFGLIGTVLVHSTKTSAQEWGRDRVFTLPLRVCAGCQPRLTEHESLRAALWRVPVYRRLLEKYPQARITVTPP
jgi:hypothetical protein